MGSFSFSIIVSIIDNKENYLTYRHKKKPVGIVIHRL